ncbi:MAG TPA: TetR/AcrR family transcriptional regulator [Alphaproteobacteria bacterium]|nr:TetR/AcrR family transcriptional regulator [Alphaproteobacteria bacterium]
MTARPQTAMSRAEASKAAATRQRILDAAAVVFVQKGYVATRLNDIARAAQMQAGSLYYHFDSKEQIFEEVLEIGMRRVFDAVRRAVEALGPEAGYRERIVVAIRAHLELLLQQSAYTSANIRNFGQIPQELQDRHLPTRVAYGDYWRDLLEGGQAAGEIRADADLSVLRMLLLGALNWALEWYDPEGRPIAAIADEVQRMLFDGIASAPKTPGNGAPPPRARKPRAR